MKQQISLCLDNPDAWGSIAGAAVAPPISEALAAAARTILDLVPRSPDRTRALNALREAGLYAGQASVTYGTDSAQV